jgi:hypothetical protein
LEGASRIAAGISVALAAPAIAQESQPVAGSDLVRREGAYIGSRACRECHDDRHASWDATFHSSMTQLPARESVLGRFDGREVALFGAAAIPHEKDGRFSFRLPAIGGEPAREAEVALCTGSNRYQQYFERVESPSGAFRRIPLLWNAVEERWWHVNGVFLEPDSDDWSRHQSLWNENCIFCHTTAPEPRLELARAEGGTATIPTRSRSPRSSIRASCRSARRSRCAASATRSACRRRARSCGPTSTEDRRSGRATRSKITSSR